ncbi:helix-turn-helix transcriptional regulator [Leucobacter weissii]|uniref:Helix-turn-helix transcriptional regulator n=1 Tax=Leucobacter weissii TaxID=1983706 RepID=A0A939MJS4_9MICO|nr:XRE family transcriptional regulator [Leucobacter weissii]MBO1901535.1 helix-turn-helix transcriptional regulator [Leucobacter weissii]
MVDPTPGIAGADRAPLLDSARPTRRSDAFGSYLREARTRHRLSQSDLAQRIGLSAGMVSQLEKGQSLPSVSTMLAIANELDVTLDSLFGAAETPAEAPLAHEPIPYSRIAASAPTPGTLPPADLYTRIVAGGNSSGGGIEAAVQRYESRSVLELEHGVTWELLTNDPNHQVLFVIADYPVGASTSSTFVRHPDVEYFLMLEGELEVSLEFERTTVRAGDSMWFDSMRPHNFENRGDVSARGVFLLIPQEYRP